MPASEFGSFKEFAPLLEALELRSVKEVIVISVSLITPTRTSRARHHAMNGNLVAGEHVMASIHSTAAHCLLEGVLATGRSPAYGNNDGLRTIIAIASQVVERKQSLLTKKMV